MKCHVHVPGQKKSARVVKTAELLGLFFSLHHFASYFKEEMCPALALGNEE